jgi:hypothetical protein
MILWRKMQKEKKEAEAKKLQERHQILLNSIAIREKRAMVNDLNNLQLAHLYKTIAYSNSCLSWST